MRHLIALIDQLQDTLVSTSKDEAVELQAAVTKVVDQADQLLSEISKIYP